MAYDQHITSAKDIRARCAIITLSDTRTLETDKSGQRIRHLLAQENHTVAAYELLPDDPEKLAAHLDTLLTRPDIDVILSSGGTGIARRDQTVPTIQQRLTTPLPGFGELFRMLSHQQIGSGAMLSRALGGVADGKLLFAMPGSTNAVDLAMTQLILPELRHLLFELRKPA
ncbi:MAG TPA: MogA/MoaB family molybdenum cofactor biosynthesis protein [Tepidisphaeraceae bacterium]|jgi:molybdenum cofactor biosynthesis protein B